MKPFMVVQVFTAYGDSPVLTSAEIKLSKNTQRFYAANVSLYHDNKKNRSSTDWSSLLNPYNYVFSFYVT